MDAVDFIVRDTERRGHRQAALWLSAVLVLLAVGMGLGLREDFVGVFTWRYLWPAVIAWLAIASFPLLYMAKSISERRKLMVWSALLAVALLVTLLRRDLTGSAEAPIDEVAFWRGTWTCFGKGCVTTALASVCLSILVFWRLPIPNRRWQIVNGLVAALVGCAMLTLHCPSDAVAHIALGHWAPGLVLLPLSLVLQRFFFSILMHKVLAQHATSLHAFADIGK